jgi:putative transcriptional regulator
MIMIKFHPSREMLNDHIDGKLSLPLTVAVSAHIEMCELCQAVVRELESKQAEQVWQTTGNDAVDFGDMLQSILAEPPEKNIRLTAKPAAMIEVAQQSYQLPGAFTLLPRLKWSEFGAVSRAKVLDEGNARANMLHIGKGGAIPKHRHQGYELTLLLAGSYSDENGTYHKGDFIYLEEGVAHTPYTENGCLCYVVQNAPIHFVSGISKVLNPFADFLY